jgi:hypothetical protein
MYKRIVIVINASDCLHVLFYFYVSFHAEKERLTLLLSATLTAKVLSSHANA